MKDWVKLMLRKELIETFKSEEDKEGLKLKLDELEHQSEEAVYYELTDYFNMDFGHGIGGPKDLMMTAFGSVSANLPQEVFLKLSEMRNLCFSFTPGPGAEIKHFVLKEDLKAGDKVLVVAFPYADSFMPYDVLRGEIAHELAHIYLGHGESFGSTKEREDAADKLAIGWGFEAEIKAHKEYMAQ